MSGSFLFGTVDAVALLRPVAVTADTDHTAVDLNTLASSGRKGLVRVLVGDVSASDSIVVNIQGRAGTSDSWETVVSSPSITVAGEHTLEYNDLKEFRYVRAQSDISGSSVSIVVSVDLILNRPHRV